MKMRICVCIARENCGNCMEKKQNEKKKRAKQTAYICMCVWTCSRLMCINAISCTSTYSRWFLSVDIKTGSFLATWPVLYSVQCTCISRVIQYSKCAYLVIPFLLSQRFFFAKNIFWVDWFIQIRLHSTRRKKNIYKYCSISYLAIEWVVWRLQLQFRVIKWMNVANKTENI